MALLLGAARLVPRDCGTWPGGKGGAHVSRKAILQEARCLLVDARELGVSAGVIRQLDAEHRALVGA